MTGFRNFNNSKCKKVLNLLKMGYLRLREIVVKRITVIEFGVNNGAGNSTSGWGTEVSTNTTKLSNMITAKFREDWNLLVGKGNVLIKDEAKVTSRVRGVKWRVMYFARLLLSRMSTNSVLEELRLKETGSNPGTGLKTHYFKLAFKELL